jgi:hypothetical protein
MLNLNFGTVYQTTSYHTATHYVCNLITCLIFKANWCLDVPPTVTLDLHLPTVCYSLYASRDSQN